MKKLYTFSEFVTHHLIHSVVGYAGPLKAIRTGSILGRANVVLVNKDLFLVIGL